MNAPEVSILVPVYRSAEILPELHRRVVHAMDAANLPFELIFVEDCGGDDSWTVVSELCLRDARLRGIRLARNYGQHNALLCAIRVARGNIVVTLDDDLQNPPEEICHLLAKLAEGFDVVYGSPQREAHGALRNVASRVTKMALSTAMGAETASKASAFRAFRTRLRDSFEHFRSPTANIDVLLTWGSARFGWVDVRHDPRNRGESGYTVSKLVTHALNMVTGYTVLPLQLASMLGLVFGVLGFVTLGFVVLRYLMEGSSVPGFAFLASIVSIFSGVQLFAIGIIGEYLARMHFRSMERPPYTVSERVGYVASEAR